MGPEREDLRAALGAWATVAVAPSKRKRRYKVDQFLFDFDRPSRLVDPDLDDDDSEVWDDEGYDPTYT